MSWTVLSGGNDGIWNVANGTHDPNATSWVNIANPGTADMTIGLAADGWTGNSLKTKVVAGSVAAASTSYVWGGNFTTIEAVYRVGTPQIARSGEAYVFVSGGDPVLCNHSRGTVTSSWDGAHFNADAGRIETERNVGCGTAGVVHRQSVVYGPSKTSTDGYLYIHDEVNKTSGLAYSGSQAVTQTNSSTIGGRTNSANSGTMTGEVYCVRLYNRALTLDEIMANQALDKVRFNLS